MNCFKTKATKIWAIAMAYVTLFCAVGVPLHADTARVQNRFNARGGTVNARDYATWKYQLGGSVTATSASVPFVPSGGGSQNTQRGFSQSCMTTMGNGRNIQLFQPGIRVLVLDGSLTETVTITGVTVDSTSNECTVTATYLNTHGKGTILQSGSFGLDEAAFDLATNAGGGVVAVDPDWQGTNAILAAAVPYGTVSFVDTRGGGINPWNIQQTAATFLAAPTTLTAVTALPSATPVGAYTTGTYFMCVAYVDIAGQEGPCSATFSQAGLATGSFIFSAPAASPGAVGYTIYISLTGGTYSLAYQVPLSNSVCTLTTLETVTPACAVANTTYGQLGATATVTAITVSTSLVDPQLAGVSGTLLTPAANGRTTYGYVRSSHMANGGIPTTMLAYTVGGIGSATPISIGSVNLPAGVMNLVGTAIRVCGRETNTDVNSALQNIDIYWDAAGSNTAGSPVKIGALASTQTGTAAAYDGNFCETFTTTVAGATATAGSIRPGPGWFLYKLTSANSTFGIGGDTNTAAIASLNLAGAVAGNGTRLNIVHTNTTGNATPQLVSLTIEFL